MCYDRFYFFYALEGQYSPFFSEAELERMGSANVEDPQIVALQRALVELFGLTAHKQSKLKRGRDFLAGEHPPVVNICAIGFDIVGYSNMAPPQQLQSIQNLNKFAKDALREMAGEDFQRIYIPTGDGMYLVLESHEQIALPLIERVQALTRQFNKSFPSSRFTFRTGVHCGPVFRYTDINENLNYAGNGINLAARVLGFGADWHVLVSIEAREMFLAQGAPERLFQDVGIMTAKHGAPIHVYNVFEHGKFGNPSSPRM
jgi:class 3 adenylate cyclase